LLDIEDLDEEEIDILKEKYVKIAKSAIKESSKNKEADSAELKE